MALWMTAERVRFLAAAVLLILCLALWKKYGGEGEEKAAGAVFVGGVLAAGTSGTLNCGGGVWVVVGDAGECTDMGGGSGRKRQALSLLPFE